jgi:hypothetical protein
MNTNALSLLAYKVAPNTFDISASLVHVSLRDQLVRGATLVRDLFVGGQFVDGDELLVVGAGAGGISAALTAAQRGVKVVVIDTAAEPFGLQSGVTTRLVGPYMYEWPSDPHNDQHFPPEKDTTLHPWVEPYKYMGLTVDSVRPLAASDLADHWRMELDTALWAPGSQLTLLTLVDPSASARELKRWLRAAALWWPSARPQLAFNGINRSTGNRDRAVIAPKFVILAAGMGSERVQWKRDSRFTGGLASISGPPFWLSDHLSDRFCGLAQESTIVVLGGGDGALQDALRCMLTGGAADVPLQVITDVYVDPVVKTHFDKAFPKLETIERQHAATRVWSNEQQDAPEMAALQSAYLEVIKPLAKEPAVQQMIGARLRDDVKEVYLAVREASLGKAYPLNRFLVLLIHEIQEQRKSQNLFDPGDKVRFHLLFETEATVIDGAVPNLSVTLSTVGLVSDVGHLSVRFGVDASKTLGQGLGISYKDTYNRRELANIPQTLWPLIPPRAAPGGP